MASVLLVPVPVMVICNHPSREQGEVGCETQTGDYVNRENKSAIPCYTFQRVEHQYLY
jgi:hypothetical protein